MAAILKFIIKGMGKNRLPQTGGAIQVQGLSAPVEIIRDIWGIPHIYAGSDHDLFFAQGFVHAQDRLWQMELIRRTSSGTLSELLGKVALDTDRALRTFGFRRLGAKDLENTTKDMIDIVSAYAEGVNACLKHPATKVPVELSLLKHVPEPWSPLDCMAFARLMTFQLNGQFSLKINYARIAAAVGEDKVPELVPKYPGENPAVSTGIERNQLGPDGVLKALDGPLFKKGGGSNSWAIAGRRTATGKPIQCSDPHLSPSVPSIWYHNHLVGGRFNITGVSVPSAPLILIGHNARISWGFTVANVDAEDFFVEKMNPDSPTQYEYKGKWLDADVFTEPIKIKGEEQPFVEKVIWTRHGPLVSDVVGLKDKRVALQSTALGPLRSLEALCRLNLAGTWKECTDAIKIWDSPNQHMTYADVDGNIGSYVTGIIPVRAKGNGLLPVPGWTGEFDWIGNVPFDEKPHSFNAKKGFVVCANNRPIDAEGYPHHIASVFDPGYRARRITETIAAKERFSIDDCMKLHVDVFCRPGLEFAKRVGEVKSDDPDVRLAIELLGKWDGNLTAQCTGGTVYEAALPFVYKEVFAEKLGEALTIDLMGRGFHPVLHGTTELFHSHTDILLNLLDNPNSWWMKQAGGKDAVLERALRKVVAWLRSKLGKDPAGWTWGRLNKMVYPHAMALKKPLDKVFNVGNVPIGGDKNTVCQIGSPVGAFSEKCWAPSYRQIVDLGDLGKALVVVPPGQSGNLASPHYQDMFLLWYRGEYAKMLWTREQVEAHAEAKLFLS
ncbi:MAG: penicillin acylase family protein [Candidatus Lokiarchaeota archaeon]|nr:penicillin acylase family protein [Candidatus Lokiarchaeota archaeon]